MDDFGDYIYIILLIVFSIVGLFKKKKQTQVLTKENSEQENYEESEEDFFPPVDVLNPKKYQTETSPSQINWPTIDNSTLNKKDKTVFDGITNSYETAQDMSQVKAKKQVKKSVNEFKVKNFLNEDDNKTENSDYSFESVEDVRKAIIFSEIINKKYN